MYCKRCGAQVGDQDAFCGKCGFSLPRYDRPNAVPPANRPVQQPVQPAQQQAYGNATTGGQPVEQEISEKSGLVVLLLALFVGYWGIHSFYAGRVGIGIAQIFTLGGCGIWALVDIILLATGSYRDGEGKLIELK